MTGAPRPTLFLDRDGTLCPERGFVTRVAELDVLDGVPAALQRLTAAGFRIVVTTNQSGIARGLYDERDLARIHERLHEMLGGQPAAYLHCPHHPDPAYSASGYGHPCTCRKPGTGLLDRAAELFAVDWSRSAAVGDAARDLLMSEGRNCKRVLVKSGKPWEAGLQTLQAAGLPPDHVADDLVVAEPYLLGLLRGRA